MELVNLLARQLETHEPLTEIQKETIKAYAERIALDNELRTLQGEMIDTLRYQVSVLEKKNVRP